MTAFINCPHCGKDIENKGDKCPRCGGALKARKARSRDPHHLSPEILKFLWIAVAFMVILVPLGMCIRPA